MAATTGTPSNGKLPHLLSWIKHKASKKEGKTSLKSASDISSPGCENSTTADPSEAITCPTDASGTLNSGDLSSSSKETLRESGGSEGDLTTEDSADAMSSTTCFSGNSIVSDSSFDVADHPRESKVSVPPPTSFHGPPVHSPGAKLMSVSTSNMSSFQSSYQQQERNSSSGYGDKSVCKHGCQANRCRACMQLPPLPPGSERVLKEIQRQAKHRLRSQSQIFSHVGDTPSCSQKVPVDPRLTGVDLTRVTTTSPEHVYEEIPVFHFQDAESQRNSIRQRHMDIVNSARNKGYHSLNRDKCVSYHSQPHVITQRPPHAMPPHAGMVAHQTQLRSHEFYPENMHSQRLKDSGANNNGKRPASRQVSLGNLDFDMAKECNGFLVVPLRDKKAGNGVSNTSNVMPHQQQWFNNQVPPVSQSFTPQKPIHRHTPFRHSTSHTINHQPSDSGFQEETQMSPEKVKSHDNSINTQGSRDSESNQDNQAVQEKYSHCKRCKRPHALYHGVTLCHSDVEDMRQELQYLDIAGLDKNKLRGKDSVLDSPSLLQNFARRRSAFAKYIPSQKPEDTEEELVDSKSEEPSSKGSEDNSSSVLMSDSYKRQSMSAESDYFSSNYNTSQSDSHSKASHEYHPEEPVTGNYTTSSERSNDTFSEYDVAQETHMGSGSQEYNFYLEKIKQNHLLEQEVQRIIRSSESERSDNERSYHSDSNVLQEDTISLTSVTSLSEWSTLPTEDATGFIRSRVHRTVKTSPKNSKRNNHKNHLPSPVDTHVLKLQRARKPIRKKRKSSKDVEYYKLPEFSVPPGKQYSPDPKETKSNSPSNSENGLKDTDHANTSMESSESIKSSDKLSCRVTDFKLADMKRSQSVKDGVKVPYTRTTSNEATGETGSRSSVYSSHNQVNKNTNNRLLSDLMRMNHDKQLFSLI